MLLREVLSLKFERSVLLLSDKIFDVVNEICLCLRYSVFVILKFLSFYFGHERDHLVALDDLSHHISCEIAKTFFLEVLEDVL